MIRLSIIVPFYNVEKYIEECIRSLYDQDIPQSEYEVICVDDCSPDGSRAIVERLQKEYKTLRLVCHERNKKLGGARNTGLREARGVYVWFVDSDDAAYPNVLKSILDVAEKGNVDIMQFDYFRGGDIYRLPDQREDIQEGEEYLFEKTSDEWFYKVAGAWRQIFKRESLINNGLLFIEDAMYEDTDYLIHAFLVANRVQYMPLLAYHYRINQESILYSKTSPAKMAWRVNLIVRCKRNIDIAKTAKAKEIIRLMIARSLSRIRIEIKWVPKMQRCAYARLVMPEINECKKYMNWRTWLAVRYGITIFV